MRFQSYITLSIVACSLLNAQAYTDWKQTTYNNEDTITIDDGTKVLNHGINVSGIVSATINKAGDCGIVACFNDNASIVGGSGTINFTIQDTSQTLPAFNTTKDLTISVKNFNVNGKRVNTLFKVNGGALKFENTNVNANSTTTAIDATNSTLNVQDSNLNFGNARINLTNTALTINNTKQNSNITFGTLNTNSSNSTIKLDKNSQINGNFVGQGSHQLTLTAEGNSSYSGSISNDNKTTLTLKGGSRINGNFTGTGPNHTLTLKATDKSTFQGSITNSGTATITLDNSSMVNGSFNGSNNTNLKFEAKNGSRFDGQTITNTQKADITLDNSTITATGGFRGTNNHQLTLKASNNSAFNGDISNDGKAEITLDNSQITGNFIGVGIGKTPILNLKAKGSSRFTGYIRNDGTANIDFQGTSSLSGGITSNGEAKIQFKETSTLSGNITGNGRTEIEFKDSTQTGNITATGTQLNVNLKNGVIDGNITTSTTTSTIEAKENSKVQRGITIQGGINTTNFSNTSQLLQSFNVNNGATANAIFSDNATFEQGTSSLDGKTDITFKNNAKAQNQTLNSTGEIKILFQNSSKFENGAINVNAGTSSITFKDSAELNNSSINTNSGRNNVVFENNAKANNGSFSISGGDFNMQVKNNAQIQGSISQSNGTSNINFDDDSKMMGNITQSNGTSEIKFDKASKMEGNINITNGVTNILFTGTSSIKGNIKAAGANNTVTFTQGTKLEGNLTLDGEGPVNGISKGLLDGTHITGKIQGYDEVNLEITNTQVDGIITQGTSFNGKGMTATIDTSTLKGGFQGTGSTSNNLLSIFGSKFENSNIGQQQGSLKAEVINTTNIKDFNGTRASNNVLEFSNSEIHNVKQEGGSLKFTTNSNINGNFTGSQDSSNVLKVTGATIQGFVSQDTGSLDLYLTNSSIQGTNSVQANNANLGLYANSSEIKGSITLTSSTAHGISSKLTLNGAFNQTGGTSDLAFSDSTFANLIKIDNATNASLVFAKSNIQNIEANNGTTSFNLADSKMKSFTGTNGSHSIILTNSKATAFNQTNGTLLLSASGLSELTSVTGNNTSLTVSLNRSTIQQNVSNTNNSTVLTLQESRIGGSITQTNGSMNFTAENSELGGSYTQNGGVSIANLTQSIIQGKIELTSVQSGSLNFNQNSQIRNGLSSSQSNYQFSLRNTSSIQNGLKQTAGNVSGVLDNNSSINGGITLSSGITSINVNSKSSINAGNGGNAILANDNQTKIVVDNASINGNIVINGGNLDLTAQNHSTITSANMSVSSADLKMLLDSNSQFIGNLSQTGGNQDITIRAESRFEGNITNNQTNSSITINNATVTGTITQTDGALKLDISNKGILGGSLILNNVQTLVSGSGENNEIKGDFTQNDGSLGGLMNGLTLTGQFSQTGGTSEVTFKNSSFLSETKIKNANRSSLTFIFSTLKGYDVEGGENNTLKLLNDSAMTGNLTIHDSSQTLLKMDNSTINGNISAMTNSTLTLDTLNSTITGDGNITINTGALKGQTDNTRIDGNITLTNTTSDVIFTNGSVIQGSITATEGENTIKFNNSQVQGNLSQTEGEIRLDLSNGSSIGGNLTFDKAEAHLTGAPANNEIKGEFKSNESTLTGDISSLTVLGKFIQAQGTSNITFRDNSNLEEEVLITEAISSKLNFINKSGISNNITITKGEDNTLNFNNQSFITNEATKFDQAKATINASDQSTLTTNITATNALSTTINLNNSTLTGNITQTQGEFTLNAQNKSNISGDVNFTDNVTSSFNLNDSSFIGKITAADSILNFTLNNSNLNTLEEPSEISLTNSPMNVNASNNSIFGANLKATSETGNHTITLNFTDNSTYSGKIELNKIKTTANFDHSTLLSDLIDLKGKEMVLSWKDSPNGGTIQELKMEESKLTILTDNSFSTINKLTSSSGELSITAQNHARLSGSAILEKTAANYLATSNGNINIDTSIKDNVSPLTVNLHGGILQGAIMQDETRSGQVTLSRSGDFGGRWAVTDNSNTNTLTLNNNPELLTTNAIFKAVFNNPLSFVDFTVEKEDREFSTRMGKELLPRPNPNGDGTIPPPAQNQTYVRQLKLQNLQGNNGFFRVYADLGNNTADNILADAASGNHTIQVFYRADTFREIGSDRIVVAKVTDNSTQVSFEGTQSDIGLTRYNTQIIKENAKEGRGFEWIIGQATPAGISYTSKIIGSILQSQYRIFSTEVDSLDRRLGYLRHIKRDSGFWVRSYYGQATQSASTLGINSTDNYYSIWSGWDYNARGLTGLSFSGVFFNYTRFNTETKDFTGAASNFSLGLYETFQANSGFYFDILAKYIYSTNAYTITSYALNRNKPQFDNHKFLANFEMGYTFYLGEKKKSSYIQPQFQITSGYVQGLNLNFIDVTGEKIEANLGHNAPVIMRFGAFWGKMFGDTIKTDLKVGSSFAYDVNTGGQLSFKDSTTSLNHTSDGDFRMLFSAHADLLFSEGFKIYSSFDTSFFGNYNTTFNINLGVRLSFGRRNDTISNIPLVYNPYTPPVMINDDTRTIPVVQKNTTKEIDRTFMGKPRKVETYIPGNSPPSQDFGEQGNRRKSFKDRSTSYYYNPMRGDQ